MVTCSFRHAALPVRFRAPASNYSLSSFRLKKEGVRVKKKFVPLLLALTLSFSLSVPAAADFSSSDSSALSDIRKAVYTTGTTLYGYVVNLYNQISGASSYSTSFRKVVDTISSNLTAFDKNFSDTMKSTSLSVNPVGYYLSQLYSGGSGGNSGFPGIINRLETNNTRLADIKENTYQSSSAVNRMETVLGKINDSTLASYTKLSGINDALHYTDSFGTASAADLLYEIDMSVYRFFETSLIQYLTPELLESSIDLEYFNSGIFSNFSILVNGYFKGASGEYQPTLYKLLYDLWEVQADDDDKALKDATRDNLKEATSSFGDALTVDNITGAASTFSGFNDWFKDSGSASDAFDGATTGWGKWFTDETKNDLDSTNSVSTLSADDGPEMYSAEWWQAQIDYYESENYVDPYDEKMNGKGVVLDAAG